MSTSNKQRRAAKQRRRARERSRSSQAGGPRFAPGPEGDLWTPGPYGDLWTPGPYGDLWDAGPPTWRGLADSQVWCAVQLMVRSPTRVGRDAARRAEGIFSRLSGVPARIVAAAMADLMGRLRREVVAGGWDRADLDELVRRRVGEEHLDTLQDRAGARATALFGTPDSLAIGLHVGALLAMLPLAPPDAQVGGPSPKRSSMSSDEAKRLATVRGLLAKAERTTFDEEADALSAKAQELISRYALDQLLRDDAGSGETAVTLRRVWLDAPYLLAKASLVDAVASANRCRCVVSESIGMCSVVGAPSDLEAVELLATSLLVQANRSMLRHGRHVDFRGVSTTRSFRQSFLVSFATRIGQRLDEVNTDAVQATGNGDRLLPALRHHHEQVDDAFVALFPQVVSSGPSVTNASGWAAGHAAADLAQLDLRAPITDETSAAS